MLRFFKKVTTKYLLVCILAFLSSIKVLFAASDYNQFMALQKSKETAITAPYANEIAQLTATAQKNAQAPDIQTYIHQLQANSHALLKASSALQPTANAGQILIFVSASMPPVSLQQWFNQAQKMHAAFIIRGFVNNSLPDTKKWVKRLMEKNNKKGGIQINPVAFERYGIQQVPAVVTTSRTIQCPSDVSCMTPPFDVVYGNMSLSQALKMMVDEGDAANTVARQALNQAREIHD